MLIQPPMACVLWRKPELLREDWPSLLERISAYLEDEHEIRRLLQCRECGQLYFYSFQEEIHWVGGEDWQYRRFIPVLDAKNASELSLLSNGALLAIIPALCSDYPQDADEPRIYWAGKQTQVPAAPDTPSDQHVIAEERKRMIPPNTSCRLASAVFYAALIHGAQKRKGTNIPYVSHLMSVSALVMENGGDEDQAIAGLLHDSLEDCGEQHEQVILQNWGPRVATIVRDCTDGVPDATGAKSDWHERKRAYLEHIASVGDDTILVSLCDKLHNARTIVADLQAGQNVFSRFKAGREGTLWYYSELAKVFTERTGGHSPAARELSLVVEKMRKVPQQ